MFFFKLHCNDLILNIPFTNFPICVLPKDMQFLFSTVISIIDLFSFLPSVTSNSLTNVTNCISNYLHFHSLIP